MKYENCKDCEFCDKFYCLIGGKLYESHGYWGCKKYCKTTLKQIKECGFFSEDKSRNDTGVLTVYDVLLTIAEQTKYLKTSLDAIKFNIMSCVDKIKEEDY